MDTKLSVSTLSLVSCLSLVVSSHAQDTIGTDDFDGNGNFTSRLFSPDNSANLGFGGTPGTFGGSNFDIFGITNRDIGFDFADDTLNGFELDDFGIVGINDASNFVGFADIENGNNTNPGGDNARIDWSYDISGYENIAVAFDWAAVGNFTNNDVINVTASIDGGASQTLFSAAGTRVGPTPGTAYTVTMENGAVLDRFFNGFFEGDVHDLLVDLNMGFETGGSTFDFSIEDADQDGFNDISGERAYQETNGAGTFQTFERNLFDSQFVVNGTGLDNNFQTISADVSGEGSTLELTLEIFQNGSREVIALDNLIITGDLIDIGTILVGDYNGNNIVDAADYTVWQDTFGDLVEFGTGADGNGDGIINAADYTIWQDNFGSQLDFETFAATFPIPEPTTGLILAGLGLMAARRRRQA